ACGNLKRERKDWDRAWHAELLNKLRDGGCPLVVFDVFFRSERNAVSDAALAEAMRRHGRVVLMARVTDPKSPGAAIAQPLLPQALFRESAARVGITLIDAQDSTKAARRHWPFPASGEGDFVSLPWRAAELAGASLPEAPVEQWLRYYGEAGGWATFSYHVAL